MPATLKTDITSFRKAWSAERRPDNVMHLLMIHEPLEAERCPLVLCAAAANSTAGRLPLLRVPDKSECEKHVGNIALMLPRPSGRSRPYPVAVVFVRGSAAHSRAVLQLVDSVCPLPLPLACVLGLVESHGIHLLALERAVYDLIDGGVLEPCFGSPAHPIALQVHGPTRYIRLIHSCNHCASAA